MGSILTNGVFLPAEGERNCYEGLAANWTVLDRLIGGYNAHIGNATIHVTAADKEAWNGKADASALTAHTGDTTIHVTAEDKQAWNGHVADTTIHVTSEDKQTWNNHVADTVKHVTAEDKQAWNGKADASALTAHTGNAIIHVTAEDKQAWNGKADASALTAHTGDTTIHVTAEDKQAWNNHVADTDKHVTTSDKATWNTVTSKADDSDVVHKTGNETIDGEKTFSNSLTMYNADSSQKTKDLVIGSSKIRVGDTSTQDSFGITFNGGVSYIASITAAKDLAGTQSLQFNVRTKDSSGNFITSMIRFRLFANGNSNFEPRVNESISLGSSSYKYKDLYTNKINNIEPSSLSLPSGDLSDIIDISSYLTVLDGSSANTYVAPANGWISITMSNCSGIQAYINGLWGHQVARPSLGAVRFLMPVLKNQTVNILISGGTIDSARFIPCRGNI